MHTVYVIKNSIGQLYKGITTNLQQRLKYHNGGLSRWTRHKGPWRLVYTENYLYKTSALKREKFFKSGQGRAFLKTIIKKS